MKKIFKSLKNVIGLLALVALALGLVWLFSAVREGAPVGQQVSPIETPPPTPTEMPWAITPVPSPVPQRTHVPTPVPPTPTPLTPVPRTPVGTPLTATPYPGEIRTPAPPEPTPTPVPISKITDLAPDLPDEEKSVYIIRRADGTYEKFLISIHYTGDVKVLMGLDPKDVLVFHYPLKPGLVHLYSGPPPRHRLGPRRDHRISPCLLSRYRSERPGRDSVQINCYAGFGSSGIRR